jgi:glucose-6-phosphate 1-epimerase
MPETTTALDRRHGIAGVAHLVEGQGGLTQVRVTTAAATGEIYLHGAHVTSWRPAGHPDALFVSAASRWEPGRGIRGGIPVCFPWFANKAGDPQAPSHGFVRTRSWTLDSIAHTGADVVVNLSIESDAQTRELWPFDFRLVLRATFGAMLHVELTATNTGDAPLNFEEALHTYYAIGDAASVRISGLDGGRYRDKVDGGRERVQQGDITIDGETDRVYLDTTAAVEIHDPALQRRLHISKSGSRSTVVWNPWIERARALADLQDDWRRMVCVETANVAPSDVVLQPGGSHRLALTVSDIRS